MLQSFFQRFKACSKTNICFQKSASIQLRRSHPNLANIGNNSGKKHSQLCCERSNGAGGAVLVAAVRASVQRAPLLSRKVAGASFPFVRNAELPRAPVGSSRASTAARNLRCRWLADELSRRRDEGEWDFSATYRACLLSAMYSKIS